MEHYGASVLMDITQRRDFPADQIPPLSAISGATAPAEGQRSDMASYLNPWLARHAVLVCSTVKVRLDTLAARPSAVLPKSEGADI